MGRWRFVWLGLAMCVATGAQAQEPQWRARSAARFEYDADVAPGLWVEGLGGHAADSFTTGEEADETSAGLRVVQGWRSFEFGATARWHQVNPARGASAGGFGDTSLFGKVVPLRSDWGNVGAGVEFLAPSGDSQRGLGAGELGIVPFFGAAAHYRQFQLRTHVAYRAYASHSDVTDAGATDASIDSVLFGGGLFFEADENFGASCELVGAHESRRGESTPLQIAPSLNFRFTFPEVDLVIRPTGLFGITSEANDWGVLGSIIVTRHPHWVSRPR